MSVAPRDRAVTLDGGRLLRVVGGRTTRGRLAKVTRRTRSSFGRASSAAWSAARASASAASGTLSLTSTRYTVHTFCVVAVRARRARPRASTATKPRAAAPRGRAAPAAGRPGCGRSPRGSTARGARPPACAGPGARVDAAALPRDRRSRVPDEVHVSPARRGPGREEAAPASASERGFIRSARWYVAHSRAVSSATAKAGQSRISRARRRGSPRGARHLAVDRGASCGAMALSEASSRLAANWALLAGGELVEPGVLAEHHARPSWTGERSARCRRAASRWPARRRARRGCATPRRCGSSTGTARPRR